MLEFTASIFKVEEYAKPEDGGRVFLQNVIKLLPLMPHPRRQYSS
jgi:hypothetical protein